MKNAIFFIGIMLFFLSSCKENNQKKNEDNQQVSLLDIDKKMDENIEKIVTSIPKINFPDRTIKLIEYSGKKPDETGSFNFQPAINKAISELSEKGGGTIYLTHSSADRNQWVKATDVYRMDGPIHLKSNIRLLLDYGTKIQFTYNPKNYLINGKGVVTRWEGVSIKSFSPLIRAFNAENTAIEAASGTGAMPIIDGDGEKWGVWSWMQSREKINGKQPYKNTLHILSDSDVDLKDREFIDIKKDYYRPNLMEFYLCKNIRVQGLQLRNTPFWTVHFTFSENAIVRNMVFNVHGENSDGVDPESSHNILIENNHFNNHDDNVAIKSGRNKEGREGVDVRGTELEGIKSKFIKDNKIFGSTENVVVRNNVFKGHHAICIGSEVAGSVRNIFVTDNSAVQKIHYGLYIKSSPKRGGIVEDVYVRNLKIEKAMKGVVLNPSYAQQDTISNHYPLFRNIFIKNISIKRTHEAPIEIVGWPKLPMNNISIENFTVNAIDKDIKDPISINNANNVFLKNITIRGKLFEGTFSDNSGKNPMARD